MSPASHAHADTSHDGASFLRQVRAGVEPWVRAAVNHAAEELASSTQRLAVAGGREHTSSVLGLLNNQREDIVQRLTQAMRAQLQAGSQAPRGGTGGDGGALSLSLIDEAQIDEEIEIARIVQLIESEADAELQELNALCSNLRRLGFVDPKAAPLRPQVCAQGLREGVVGLGADAGARLLLLRSLGTAIGQQMREVYRAQVKLLHQWGVQPAQFKIKPTPAARPLPAGMTRPADLGPAELPQPARQSMERLVEWARATAPAALEPAAPADGGLSLRLLDDPAPAGLARGQLPRPAAEQLMQRLFHQLGAHGEVSPAARQLVQGLEWAGRQLVAQDPGLWAKPDHPWWTLIDRLLAVGAVHDDLGAGHPDALHQSLHAVVHRIQQAPQLDPQACQAAADEVQAVASRLLEGDTSALLGQVSDLQREADREELENELRRQLVQQLRSTPVCQELRRFLVGPWTQVMAAQAQRHGQDSGELAAAALVVDDLIRATARPGVAVSPAQRAVLLRQVQEGLKQASLPPARVEAEVVDMGALLNKPPAHQDHTEAWQEAVDTLPAPHVLDLHAGLPTVPLGMGDDASAPDPAEWVSSLQAGAYCRLFLQGQWLTAQLRWVSPSSNLFLFNSRHGGRSHSLTRRMLQKLRSAGLATSIEDGFLLAQAMDTLASTSM